MNGELILVMLIIIGLVGRSNVIATSSSLLLIIKLTTLERLFPIVERRGLEIGLLFLTMAVLVPFANERIGWKEVKPLFNSLFGWLALAGGALATVMNGIGLDLLKLEPQTIVGLVIGSIIGIVGLRGVPCGPLMCAGVTALLLKAGQYFFG